MALSDATEFGKLCRKYRLAHDWSHEECAQKVGLETGTISTIEGSRFRVVGPERAAIMADAFGLVGEERKQFLDEHERTELSPYGKRREEYWKKRNAQRSKIKNYDPLRYAACELAIRFIMEMPVGEACRCDFGGGSYGDAAKPCEVCFLLEKVGIFGGLGDQERTLTRLHAIMTELEPTVFPGRPTGH